MSDQICLYIYTSIIGFSIIITILRSSTFFKFCVKSSETLHKSMFLKIINAPMVFFNSSSSGIILNRFSKDMSLIDEVLPVIMMDTFQVCTICISSTNSIFPSYIDRFYSLGKCYFNHISSSCDYYTNRDYFYTFLLF